MKFFLFDLFEKKQKQLQTEPVEINLQESLHHITDGGEFLDDAIRMQDLPYNDMHTEISIAPGNASDLW